VNVDHVPPRYVAEALRVTETAVQRWIRDGRLFAEKRGGKWFIPRSDAMLFIKEYGRKVGTPLEPAPRGRVETYNPQHTTRAECDQHLNINVPAWLLRSIDDLRRQEEKPRTRTAFIRAALEEWVPAEKRRRRLAAKKAVSSASDPLNQ
jgi:excisionase family DNA binding protein